MFQSCVKYFFMILCGFYLYSKLLNLKGRKHLLIYWISSLFLAIVMYHLRLFFVSGSILILVILFTAITYLIHKQPTNVTIVSSILAMGCSYVSFILSAIVLSPVSLVLMRTINDNTIL